MSYDELVRELRKKAEFLSTRAFELNTPNPYGIAFDKAADAIEELQQTVEHYKGCADDWYKEALENKPTQYDEYWRNAFRLVMMLLYDKKAFDKLANEFFKEEQSCSPT